MPTSEDKISRVGADFMSISQPISSDPIAGIYYLGAKMFCVTSRMYSFGSVWDILPRETLQKYYG